MEDYSTDNRSVKHWSGQQPKTATKSVFDHNDRLLCFGQAEALWSQKVISTGSAIALSTSHQHSCVENAPQATLSQHGRSAQCNIVGPESLAAQVQLNIPHKQSDTERASQLSTSHMLQHPRTKHTVAQMMLHCRGDVGSWVREAAMGVLPVSLALMYALQPNQATQHTAIVLRTLLKQAVERIARLREV